MLRRTKQTQIDGEPVVKLPSREVSLVKQQFSKQEQKLYDQLKARSKAEFQVMQISILVVC